MKKTIAIIMTALVTLALLTGCEDSPSGGGQKKPSVPVVVDFTISVEKTGDVAGDKITATPATGKVGDTVKIKYTLVDEEANNMLTLSTLTKSLDEQITAPASNVTINYLIDAADADEDGVITITAEFIHSDKEIIQLRFADPSVTKPYGDPAFSISVANEGLTGVKYVSSAPAIASVTEATGEVTIKKVGTATITASKVRDATNAYASGTYSLSITQRQLTATATIEPKVYDGTATAVVKAVTLTNKVGADVVTATGTGSFNSPNVKDATSVTVTYTIAGAAVANYIAPVTGPVPATITKAPGRDLNDTLEEDMEGRGDDYVTLNPVILSTIEPGYAQTVEYGMSQGPDTLPTAWQDTLVFSGLDASGTEKYYFWARSKESDNCFAGTALRTEAVDMKHKPNVIRFDDLHVTKTYSVDTFTNAFAAGYVGKGTGLKTFTSSEETVATIDSAGLVTLVGAGNTTIKVVMAGDDNYTGANAEFTLAVNPKELTITGVTTPASKVYDGTTDAEITGTALLVGVINADAATLDETAAVASFDDKNFGTGKTVTFSGYDLSGAKAGNYVLTQPASLTAEITRKQLTVADTVVPVKAVGEATVVVVGTVTGIAVGDDVTVTAVGTFAKETIDTNIDVTVVYDLTGNDAANYIKPANETLTSEITQKRGSTVSVPTAYKTGTKIIINKTVKLVSDPGSGQTIEYAIGETTSSPGAFTASNEFIGEVGKSYYVFAQSASISGVCAPGVPSVSTTKITINDTNREVVFGFDSGNWTLSSIASWQPNGAVSTVTIVNEPSSSNKVIQTVNSTGNEQWNQGPVVQLTLPETLGDYKSFSFRIRRITPLAATGDVLTGKTIYVYAAATTTPYLEGDKNQYSGAGHASLDSYKVGDTITGVNLAMDEWVEYTIDCKPGTSISSLKTFYLGIGMNSKLATYIIDDLTFVLKDGFIPSSIITPETATFDRKLSEQKDVVIGVKFNGNHLSSISNGSTVVAAANYTVGSDTITIKKEYLAGLPYNFAQPATKVTTLTFTFDGGKPQTLVITSKDSGTDPKEIASYDFANGAVLPQGYPKVSNGYSATVSGGALNLTKSGGWTDGTFTLPFTLEGPISSYKTLKIYFTGFTGNWGWRYIDVDIGGTKITAGGQINQDAGTTQTVTLTLNSTANTTGEVDITFKIPVDNITFKITKIELLK